MSFPKHYLYISLRFSSYLTSVSAKTDNSSKKTTCRFPVSFASSSCDSIKKGGFLREAWLLTTVSVVIGCAIYFQFATAHGLYEGFMSRNPAVHLWFDDFGTHFLVVSAIVYLIILCTVLIGTAIPAAKIVRTSITNALRDE